MGNAEPIANNAPGDKAAPRTTVATACRVDRWCYRQAGSGRDGRDGIYDNAHASCMSFIFI
jgi:hypothetical protein